MEIRRAQSDNLLQINELIASSRAHWNFPREYFQASLALLKIDLNYLSENLCFEIHEDGQLAGFFSITEKRGEKYLDHLWILPRLLHRGLGRAACQHIDAIAVQQGWRTLLTCPEPEAEGFYVRQGFRDTGIRVASRIEGGPVYSVFNKHYDSFRSGTVSGLSHLTLAVRTLQESVNFYEEILGFELLAIRKAKSAYLRSQDLWLALIEDNRKTISPEDGSHVALFASGTNYERLTKRLADAQTPIWQENRSPGRSIYVLDPSGNKLEIHDGTWRDRIDTPPRFPSKHPSSLRQWHLPCLESSRSGSLFSYDRSDRWH